MSSCRVPVPVGTLFHIVLLSLLQRELSVIHPVLYAESEIKSSHVQYVVDSGRFQIQIRNQRIPHQLQQRLHFVLRVEINVKRKMILNMKTTTTWLPSAPAAGKLFVTGATLGPVVDSLHNQCLLKYDVAPIVLDAPSFLNTATAATAAYYDSHFLASSWVVPPLLGVAYVLLGGILPRLLQKLIDTTTVILEDVTPKRPSRFTLGLKAVLAVLITAAIIKLSEYLILNPYGNVGILDNTAAFESAESAEQHILILITAAITQWAYLDGTLAALLVASMASIVGPLSELPFVAAGFWEYLPEAGDIYVPLQTIAPASGFGHFLQRILGDNYQNLALNSITGPCYFAVTMDAIALGRWFDARSEDGKVDRTPASTLKEQENATLSKPATSNETIGQDPASSFEANA